MRARWALAAMIMAIIISGTYAASLPPVTGNVSVSEKHPPTYLNSFTRFYIDIIKSGMLRNLTTRSIAEATTGYNRTNATKLTPIERPRLTKPNDLLDDEVISSGRILLDPRTCPNDLAYCYQLRLHNQTELSAKNTSALSTYQLPPSRIKMFVCIGNDTACVQSATNCFCPQSEVPSPPIVWGKTAKCSDTTHLCLSSYGSFKLCTGNLSACQAQYNVCGCGRYAACIASKKNTCVNDRNELTLCAGTLSECLNKYKTCYCGSDMMHQQQGCPATSHSCAKDGEDYTCHGTFNDCAINADYCACGTA